MRKRTKTTIDQGWASTQEIAPEPLPADPIQLPGAERALEVLQRLAELNDRVLAAAAAYQEAATRAKAKKGKWEELSAALSKLLKDSTHGSSTPLFDAVDAEADLNRMEMAVEAAGKAAGEPQGATSALESSAVAPVSQTPVEAAGEGGSIIPFPTPETAPAEIF